MRTLGISLEILFEEGFLNSCPSVLPKIMHNAFIVFYGPSVSKLYRKTSKLNYIFSSITWAVFSLELHFQKSPNSYNLIYLFCDLTNVSVKKKSESHLYDEKKSC